jgi:phenylacetate-coenzyme A ligase PaaK-like adenylate-forming protein
MPQDEKQLKEAVLNISKHNFEDLALEIFQFQLQNNQLYAQFVKSLCTEPSNIKKVEQIPCLPIELFKYHTIRSSNAPPNIIFESSGTTLTQKSKHYLTDTAFYEQNSVQIFERKYGSLQDYHILALLPSYLEQGHSSLVFMIKHFIDKTQSEESGFYLYDYTNLQQKIQKLLARKDRKVMLVGVTYALLDFAEQFPNNFSDLIVMETGGMKGRRKEMIREEVHEILSKQWNIERIHSEYGMTELLSQAYSQGEGIFDTPETMRIFLREINDPKTLTSKRGLINVIDLANIESCSFIATQDVGSWVGYNKFTVMGRADNSEQRGCNLMIQS